MSASSKKFWKNGLYRAEVGAIPGLSNEHRAITPPNTGKRFSTLIHDESYEYSLSKQYWGEPGDSSCTRDALGRLSDQGLTSLFGSIWRLGHVISPSSPYGVTHRKYVFCRVYVAIVNSHAF